MNLFKIDSKDFNKLENIINQDDLNKRIDQINNRELDIYVVEIDNICVGRIFVNYVNHLLDNETIPNKRVCLSHFFVKDEFRSMGIGSKLLDYTLNELAKYGYNEFTIGVEDKNETAKHIYFNRGFNEKINHGSIPTEYDLYLKK